MADPRAAAGMRIAAPSRLADSVESSSSWIAAALVIGILSISYGAPLIVVIGLKSIAAGLDSDRSMVALAAALVWVGTGTGGILMGWVADRVGVRRTVIFGAVMTAFGLAVSSIGRVWTLYLGHALLIGFLGGGALYPPLLIYISRWFDRRRGTALALISSGQYVAGVIWPSVFQRALAWIGWQQLMLAFGAVLLLIVPMAMLLSPAPQPSRATAANSAAFHGTKGLRLRPNSVQVLLCAASFLCCVPMAMPSSHLVAFCSDVGIAPAQGAAMLSVLLGCAFVSRQFWGWAADRIGGLGTVFAGSACQALAIAAFSVTRSEAGLFAVSAAYGLGFSGIIPAYVLAIREFFPSSQASWRVPALLFTGMSGMAFGSWFAGALYDYFGFYAPAFAAGALFNLGNLTVIGFLLLRQVQAARLAVA
ncbi:MAG TPA: MFS transporter [Stellaceae bacterium]|nr:MFS transporter [Stellaceae bacterium]